MERHVITAGEFLLIHISMIRNHVSCVLENAAIGRQNIFTQKKMWFIFVCYIEYFQPYHVFHKSCFLNIKVQQHILLFTTIYVAELFCFTRQIHFQRLKCLEVRNLTPTHHGCAFDLTTTTINQWPYHPASSLSNWPWMSHSQCCWVQYRSENS